jgi:type I restriction enzyme R subunit
MTPSIAERAFETAIECALLAGGPDACPGGAGAVREAGAAYGDQLPGGYRRRRPEGYDRHLCLIPKDLLDFVMATQPRAWARLMEHHGKEVKERFLTRLAREIELRGALDVLRNGIKDSGVKVELVYFRPASRLNAALQTLYEGNLFSIVRQLHYSERDEGKSLDLGLFLNGIPLFTAELKNPLTGQTVNEAIRQYKTDRDPREPLLAFRRCLAHFAVDPDQVYVATELAGQSTRFLPFNRGKFGGAGNPPVPPTSRTYPTSYLWDQVWARDSVLNLIEQFVQDVEEEDEKGRNTGARRMIFPRYHQLDSVRRLVADAKASGPGRHYLIQHSAGSGKSNSIAWLAHQLSVLHDAEDRRVFDSIVVVTDRRVLDRQLQRTVRQFQQTLGVVENIDKTGQQLKDALQQGKTIIVTTLQKFPVIANQIGELPGQRFAVIVDEAHSSQSGESTKSLKTVLTADGLEEAELNENLEEEDLEDRIVAEMKSRGRLPNVSFFAFTATPKPKTLELFGQRRADGQFEAFSLYTMRQAIEEGFILDVLEHYTTYKVFWSLLKRTEDDPRYDRTKASYLLRAFVDLHPHAIGKKVDIMATHFAEQVAHRIGGRAKAMIVTRSRLHAVRYKLALDEHLKAKGLPYRALVAFSGTVHDGGVDFTETGMNGSPESQTAETFKRPEYRFMVVAEKFQTGFDQPLLHTMYVDKKLGGVNAVQTLSRLNRTHLEKTDTMVLDFANEAEEIQKAFQPYYERTLLTEATDPHLLYDLQRCLLQAGVFVDADVLAFAKIYFNPKSSQAQLYAGLRPFIDRHAALAEAERTEFLGHVTDYVRLYAFLGQILTFADPDLERLYVFTRLLRRYLGASPEPLPLEVQQQIDMESFRVQQRMQGTIPLARGPGEVEPMGSKDSRRAALEDLEPLSLIIRELNQRFGTDFSEEDRVFIRQLEDRLAEEPALAASVRANTPENARLTFDQIVTDRLQDMVDVNFKFYKRVTDDQQFSRFFLDWLFERFRRGVGP